MTAINFPDSPSDGDTHVVGGVTYTYNNAETKWKTTINSNAFLPLTGGTLSGNLTTTGDVVLGGELQHSGDTDTKLHFDTDTIKLDTAGSERFRVGSAGQLGIGGATYGTDGQVLTSTGATTAPAWETLTTGRILQVVQGEETDVLSFSISAQQQWNTILSTSITPVAANSNILVMWHTSVSTNSINQRGTLRLLRGSTAIGVGDAASNRNRGSHASLMLTDYNNYSIPVSQNFMDDPTYTLTDSITYTLQASFEQSAGTLYVNRSGDDSDNNTQSRGATFVQLLEVAA